MIIRMCRFFHKLPSEILDEDAEILQLMGIYNLAHPGGEGHDG